MYFPTFKKLSDLFSQHFVIGHKMETNRVTNLRGANA
jgi:hypothetical protein